MERVQKEVGLRLKKLREILDLSQGKLARILGVSQSAVSKWEAGERDIPTAVLLKLKQQLGVNLDWLLSGEGEIFSPPKGEGNITPEIVDFFKQFPPETQRKFVEFFKDTLAFLSKSSQISSSQNTSLLKNNS